MILEKKINNELSVEDQIERHHEVALLEITFGEECNFKKHIENICHVAKVMSNFRVNLHSIVCLNIKERLARNRIPLLSLQNINYLFFNE